MRASLLHNVFKLIGMAAADDIYLILYNEKMDNLPVINEAPSANTSAVEALIEVIRSEIEQGMERARQAMEQEKKRTYWNVGKHIKEHLLRNAKRAQYGQQLITRIASALSMGQSVLYDSLQFYEQYQNIFPAKEKLTWTHIRTLLTVPEQELRQIYEEKIVEENLSVRNLRELIKKDKGLPQSQQSEAPPVLSVSRDKPYVYRIAKIGTEVSIELGFRVKHVYLQEDLENGLVVSVEKQGQNYSFIPTEKGSYPHYTYKAKVLEVLDGDTIWAEIDLGFYTKIEQKLRLRGLNTKEIETSSGTSARDFIISRLNGCKFIAVKTHWRDKFDRYLADIFYDDAQGCASAERAKDGESLAKNEPDFPSLIQNGKYLNQELLDKGLAVRYYD